MTDAWEWVAVFAFGFWVGVSVSAWAVNRILDRTTPEEFAAAMRRRNQRRAA